MQYRELGNSGLSTSVIGLGAWAIGGWMWGGTDEQKSIGAVHAAIDAGINLLDTAPAYGYGLSEEIIGKAVHDRRDRVLLATKCGIIWDREEGEFFFHSDAKGWQGGPSSYKFYRCLRPQSIREELHRSLKRLGTDRIDLLQTHWQDSTTPIQDTMAELLRMKQEGKIRAIGVSNASVDHIKAYGAIDSAQERYSMIDRGIEESGVLGHCRNQRIAVLAYSPLANGLLTGRLLPDRQFGEGDLRKNNPRFTPENLQKTNTILNRLAPIATAHQATIGQVVIAWTAAQPGITCVLCGMRDAVQAAENAKAGIITLKAEELAAVDQVADELAKALA